MHKRACEKSEGAETCPFSDAQVVLLFSFNIRTLRADLWSIRGTIHLEDDGSWNNRPFWMLQERTHASKNRRNFAFPFPKYGLDDLIVDVHVKVWPAPLRDPRQISMTGPCLKLQWDDHSSDQNYLTSIRAPGFAAASGSCAHQVRMSEVWPAPLRDLRPNQHDRTVSKLQWGDQSSDPEYLTSTTPGFARESAHQVRMSEVWPAPLRDARPNQHDRTVPKLQWDDQSCEPKYLTSTTPGFAAESAQNRHMGRCPSSNRPATLLDCSWCNCWHSTYHCWQTHGDKNVHLPLREWDGERRHNLSYVRSTFSVIAAIVSGALLQAWGVPCDFRTGLLTHFHR